METINKKYSDHVAQALISTLIDIDCIKNALVSDRLSEIAKLNYISLLITSRISIILKNIELLNLIKGEFIVNTELFDNLSEKTKKEKFVEFLCENGGTRYVESLDKFSEEMERIAASVAEALEKANKTVH